MICFPNIKINLGLHIVARRADGYHDIETVFYPVRLCDALEIVPAEDGKTSFVSSGIPIDGRAEDNLVMKALHLLKKEYDLPELAVYLRKNIPAGAGLGGGSSDAAFMIKLINDFASLNLSVEQMEKYAATLGSDCPFFIQNQPVFAEGTGTVFSSVNLSLQEYSIVLVKPDIHVSTKEAYAQIQPRKPEFSITEIIQLPVKEWKNKLVNDFEVGVFALYPAIEEIKQKLYEKGAMYASMSGSGSTVFGIFEQPEKPNLDFPGCFCYCQ